MRKECHSRWISIRRRVDKGENGIGNRRPGQEEDAKVVEDCQPGMHLLPGTPASPVSFRFLPPLPLHL